MVSVLTHSVLRVAAAAPTPAADFRAMAVSPRGEWVYALGEDSVLYCFSTAAGKLEHIMQVRRRFVCLLGCFVEFRIQHRAGKLEHIMQVRHSFVCKLECGFLC
jgi:hypothetical protein